MLIEILSTKLGTLNTIPLNLLLVIKTRERFVGQTRLIWYLGHSQLLWQQPCQQHSYATWENLGFRNAHSQVSAIYIPPWKNNGNSPQLNIYLNRCPTVEDSCFFLLPVGSSFLSQSNYRKINWLKKKQKNCPTLGICSLLLPLWIYLERWVAPRSAFPPPHPQISWVWMLVQCSVWAWGNSHRPVP